MYVRFHALVKRKLDLHRSADSQDRLDADLAAWAILGLGTIANLGRELSILDAEDRGELLSVAGRLLAEGRRPREAQAASRRPARARKGRR